MHHNTIIIYTFVYVQYRLETSKLIELFIPIVYYILYIYNKIFSNHLSVYNFVFWLYAPKYIK